MKRFDINYKNHCVKVTDKDIKVVMKCYINGEFRHSIIVPTDYRPLPSNDYEIFTSENTDVITDPELLKLINTVKFSVGRCYSISQELYDLLSKHGYNPVVYEGWCVIVGSDRAMHHCVVKVGNSVIDSGMSDLLRDNFNDAIAKKGEVSLDESRYILADLIERDKDKPISETNPTLGKISRATIFVGSPSNPDRARLNYNILMDKYPNHEDYTGNGITRYGNKLNKILLERGID